MAEYEKERTLEETSTWAIAVVCFVLLLISLLVEHFIHLVEKFLKKRRKVALVESLEKVKSELMLLGFLSLLLSGKYAFVTAYGIHQLHIFIFVLAIMHVLYCLTTLVLGNIRMRRWKTWEDETRTLEYTYHNDPQRFRFTRDTTFGRRHLNFWSRSTITLWMASFFRQFFTSVTKVDYLTLRHGFIIAHLPPGNETTFDFQKYINRTLEEDFKVMVGISPVIWFSAVLLLLTNTHGWHSYFWLPVSSLVIVLLVGTKLQVIITEMGLRIQERGNVVKGTPVVRPGDELFWFGQPCLVLYLLHFILFQNAFELAFFAWSTYEFGFKNCFHPNHDDAIIRVSLGVFIQVLCSYVTLPLYALVTQMGSAMKTTIFHEHVAVALKQWHHTAKKHAKASRHHHADGTSSHASSRPATPLHGTSPIYLLHNHNRVSHLDNSPRASPFRTSAPGNGDQYYTNLDSQFRRPDHDGCEIREQDADTGPIARHQDMGRQPRPRGGRIAPQDGSDPEEADINLSDLSISK
ncbi:hypothetical protein CDL15_Pgr022697 [Punica granatum]|uniref:MLO-like protein n=1 Tax=Punica granatum TaxID=22663 RepID=A0A218XQX6_PUNGR|nr:hypothetical protein CDL15_Pgr022697 [Punica granatum]